jgi:septal ring factor EnvC (AmiA/AmiB activator)
MGRIGITKDDVFAACKTLLKEGANLTVANVREELGTGSYTTLLPLIDAFKTSFKETTEQAAAEGGGLPALPVDLGDQGSKFIQDIWWQATTQANKRIEEVSAQFKKELAEMQTQLTAKAEELAQALTDITRLEKELGLIVTENDEKTKGLSQKDGEINLLKSQLKDKDGELKSYLERAVAAEKKIEFLKEERDRK